MKKIFILFCISFFVGKNSIAQNPNIIWQKCFGGSAYEEYPILISTNDGGFLFSGVTDSNNGDVTNFHGGSWDSWVVKIDSVGSIQWKQTLGGSGEDAIYSNCKVGLNYYFLGISDSQNGTVGSTQGHSDIWLTKLDSAGNLKWSKTYGGSNYDDGNSIQPTPDSGFIIVGSSSSTDGDIGLGNHGLADCLILKVDSAGNIQWKKIIGGSSSEFLTSVCSTSDGGYAAFGNSLSSDQDIPSNRGGSDYLVIKLDSSGSIQWIKTYGGSGSDIAIQGSIIQKDDGGFLVSGSTTSNDFQVSGNHGGSDFWVLSLSSTGSIQWQKCFGGIDSDLPFSSILKTIDGNYVITGSTGATGNPTQCLMIFFDENGTMLSSSTYGGSLGDDGSSVLQCANGDYIFTGSTSSNNGDVSGSHNNNDGYSDIWVVKLSESVGINEIEKQNAINIFPNPATNQLTVESAKAINTIEITDALGRRVSGFGLGVSGSLNLKSKIINLRSFPSGIYFIKLYFVDGSFEVKKFVKE